MSHPPCVVCGVDIERRPGEQSHNFSRRRSCGGPECLGALRCGGRKMKTPPHSPCPICGGDVIRRNGEDLSHFRRRVTCGDPTCVRSASTLSQRLIFTEDVEWLLDSGEIPERIAARMGVKQNSLLDVMRNRREYAIMDRLKRAAAC